MPLIKLISRRCEWRRENVPMTNVQHILARARECLNYQEARGKETPARIPVGRSVPVRLARLHRCRWTGRASMNSACLVPGILVLMPPDKPDQTPLPATA